ncbi:MAG: hypothetical protein LBC31_08595 [Treponema sp.]|jgi:hypothetical protein|nr:hypothetical protein [Treponema sp.]
MTATSQVATIGTVGFGRLASVQFDDARGFDAASRNRTNPASQSTYENWSNTAGSLLAGIQKFN